MFLLKIQKKHRKMIHKHNKPKLRNKMFVEL